MRIFTCTPVAFGGGPDFFARDSGLLCRGFQVIGIESRAVMPGEGKPEDEADLIRTEYRNLESAEWWKAQGIDAIVLYSWGRPKFRNVAKAIREAGIFLILSQDNAGQISPLTGISGWLRAHWIYGGQGRGLVSWLRFIKFVLRGFSVGLLLTDPLRARHLKCGDVIACVSPLAAEQYRKLCKLYGGAALAGRVEMIPHAVEPRFRYSGEPKRRQIACVGRWPDTVQKRTSLLMDTLGDLLETDDKVSAVIAGKLTPQLQEWHSSLPHDVRNRVDLRGLVGRDGLAELLAQSQIFYSPSAYESFGIAAAEALCAGCSVVAGRSVAMPSFEWFVSEKSGRLADQDDEAGHAKALAAELEAWDSGLRNAESISGTWRERLHADKIAAKILGMAAR
jgi:glycosyltransferase involved in cell wall biosynthesis